MAKKAAKKAAKKVAAKVAKPKAEKVAKKVKDEKNGIVRPGAGTTTRSVWDMADTISEKTKEPATRAALFEATRAKQINDATAATQFGKWRAYHGLKGVARVKVAAKKAAAKKKVAAKKTPAKKAAKPAKQAPAAVVDSGNEPGDE